MDTSILEDLGLTSAEIKVYITLLELGTAHAGIILEKSGIQNSVMHRALNSLIEKGIVSFILEGKRRVYQAVDPDNFHAFIEDKRRRFDELLPDLKQRQLFAQETTFAQVYKGKRGINELYMKLISTDAEEYNTFGGGSRVTHDVMGETWWKSLHTKRIARKLKSRQLFDETIREYGKKLGKKKLTTIRFLPKEFEQLQETIIVGEYVGIVIFTENPYGILIHDRAVAEGYRKQFEVLWSISKE